MYIIRKYVCVPLMDIPVPVKITGYLALPLVDYIRTSIGILQHLLTCTSTSYIRPVDCSQMMVIINDLQP